MSNYQMSIIDEAIKSLEKQMIRLNQGDINNQIIDNIEKQAEIAQVTLNALQFYKRYSGIGGSIDAKI